MAKYDMAYRLGDGEPFTIYWGSDKVIATTPRSLGWPVCLKFEFEGRIAVPDARAEAKVQEGLFVLLREINALLTQAFPAALEKAGF